MLAVEIIATTVLSEHSLLNSLSFKSLISMLTKLDKKEDCIISGVEPINLQEALDLNEAKCALIKRTHKIKYLSRQPIVNFTEDSSDPAYFKQLGLFAFSRHSVRRFTSLPVGELERAEDLELIRALENDFTVLSCIINDKTISVDTPNDLERVINKVKKK